MIHFLSISDALQWARAPCTHLHSFFNAHGMFTFIGPHSGTFASKQRSCKFFFSVRRSTNLGGERPQIAVRKKHDDRALCQLILRVSRVWLAPDLEKPQTCRE